MPKKKKQRRSLVAALFSALLTLIDLLCEGLGATFMAAVRLLGRALSALLRGLLWLVRALLRGLAVAHAYTGAPQRAAVPETDRPGV